jgi:hypothetical protein
METKKIVLILASAFSVILLLNFIMIVCLLNQVNSDLRKGLAMTMSEKNKIQQSHDSMISQESEKDTATTTNESILANGNVYRLVDDKCTEGQCRFAVYNENYKNFEEDASLGIFKVSGYYQELKKKQYPIGCTGEDGEQGCDPEEVVCDKFIIKDGFESLNKTSVDEQRKYTADNDKQINIDLTDGKYYDDNMQQLAGEKFRKLTMNKIAKIKKSTKNKPVSLVLLEYKPILTTEVDICYSGFKILSVE